MSEQPLPVTENGKLVKTHYSQRFCPELSKVTLMIPQSPIVTPGIKPFGPKFSSCMGIACMWFIPVVNEKNEIIDGVCAVTQSAIKGTK